MIQWDQHHLAMRTNGECECATELGDDIFACWKKDRREVC